MFIQGNSKVGNNQLGEKCKPIINYLVKGGGGNCE